MEIQELHHGGKNKKLSSRTLFPIQNCEKKSQNSDILKSIIPKNPLNGWL